MLGDTNHAKTALNYTKLHSRKFDKFQLSDQMTWSPAMINVQLILLCACALSAVSLARYSLAHLGLDQ